MGSRRAGRAAHSSVQESSSIQQLEEEEADHRSSCGQGERGGRVKPYLHLILGWGAWALAQSGGQELATGV